MYNHINHLMYVRLLCFICSIKVISQDMSSIGQTHEFLLETILGLIFSVVEALEEGSMCFMRNIYSVLLRGTSDFY